MEDFLSIFESGSFDTGIIEQVKNTGTSIMQYGIFIAIIFFGFLLISAMAKFLFKKGQINLAISSTIGIFFAYVIAVVIYCFGWNLESYLVPLPFVALVDDYMVIFPILNASFPQICCQVLNFLMIAFLVNLLNSLIPNGKNVFVWFLLRFLSVVVSAVLIYVLDLVLATFVPQGIAQYAPMILVLVLILLMILGSMKLLIGAVLAYMNPIVGVLYTFFFNNFIGKALAKSILSTALFTGLIYALNAIGIYAVHIAPSVLPSYIPLLIVVLVLWYIIGHLLADKEK